MADRDIPGPRKKKDPDAFSQLPSARLSATPGTLQIKGGACVASSTNPRPPSPGMMLSMLLAAFVMVDPSCPHCRSSTHHTSYHALNTRRRARESCWSALSIILVSVLGHPTNHSTPPPTHSAPYLLPPTLLLLLLRVRVLLLLLATARKILKHSRSPSRARYVCPCGPRHFRHSLVLPTTPPHTPARPYRNSLLLSVRRS